MGLFERFFGPFPSQQYQNPYQGLGQSGLGLNNLGGLGQVNELQAAMLNQSWTQACANQQQESMNTFNGWMPDQQQASTTPEYDIDGTCEDVTERKLLAGPKVT